MKPAFIVDGRMEQLIIQKVCPKHSKIIRNNKNGDDVPISLINKTLKSLISILIDDYQPIFIIIDRERREVSAEDMREDIKKAMHRAFPGSKICVVVADRCTENWILADPSVLPAEVDVLNVEGTHGKGKIKTLFKKIKRNYHEINDGVQMFCKINPITARKNSKSFMHLSEVFRDECGWLKNRHSKG